MSMFAMSASLTACCDHSGFQPYLAYEYQASSFEPHVSDLCPTLFPAPNLYIDRGTSVCGRVSGV